MSTPPLFIEPNAAQAGAGRITLGVARLDAQGSGLSRSSFRWSADAEIMRVGVDCVSWRGARFTAVLVPESEPAD